MWHVCRCRPGDRSPHHCPVPGPVHLSYLSSPELISSQNQPIESEQPSKVFGCMFCWAALVDEWKPARGSVGPRHLQQVRQKHRWHLGFVMGTEVAVRRRGHGRGVGSSLCDRALTPWDGHCHQVHSVRSELTCRTLSRCWRASGRF